jgi:hypothetical protein
MESISNFWIVVIGWVAWTVLNLSMSKDELDDTDQAWQFIPYLKKNWDNWLASAAMIPVLLIAGSMGFGFNPLSEHELSADAFKWDDVYYLGVGLFTERAIIALKKWRAKAKASMFFLLAAFIFGCSSETKMHRIAPTSDATIYMSPSMDKYWIDLQLKTIGGNEPEIRFAKIEGDRLWLKYNTCNCDRCNPTSQPVTLGFTLDLRTPCAGKWEFFSIKIQKQ